MSFLGDGHEIRLDALVFDREQLARAAEAGLDLVDDHHDAVLVADLAQLRKEAGRRRVEATLALHGLDDHRRDALRLEIRLEQLVESRESPIEMRW